MPTFDVVSKVAWHEIDNAMTQAQKEISQRFDFKGTNTTLEKTSEGLSIRSSTDDRVKAAVEVLKEKLIRRKVSLKHLDEGKIEPTGGGGSKTLVKIKEGIDADHARKLVGVIKECKIKVQASIQGDQLRISGKKRDDLQAIISLLREKEFDLELQFNNFRE